MFGNLLIIGRSKEKCIEYKEINSKLCQIVLQAQDIEVQHNIISINCISGNKNKLTSYESKNKPTSLDRVCINLHQPCRRTIETDSSNKMVSINRDIQRLDRIFSPFDVDMFLISEQAIIRNQRSDTLWVAMEQSLLLPPVNSNITYHTKRISKKSNNDNNNANVEASEIMPDPKSVKYPLLKNKSSNTISVKRRSRYYLTQKDFMIWRHDIGIAGEITAPDIINYLSKIFIEKKLKQSTTKAYK
ncbi:hypothetical protein BB561_000124 [Smittium simulii]|uniref:Uncharacterized protein n=1 Tax=Smittium simulii TaxID=133385 RepID=A0A2T9Z0S0_9FUNG|nr:hypothetical protein BB561_000124 [Smittium simulii]